MQRGEGRREEIGRVGREGGHDILRLFLKHINYKETKENRIYT
jgi:hypothetical protein